MTQVKDLVDAYDAFITGCKADGTWSAIKTSCIMAGWDNLNGALVPLVGTASTNFNFWGDADPDWADVSLLLRMNGANGGTTFTDSSSNTLTVTSFGNAQTSTAQSKFGGSSALFDGSGDYLSLSSNSVFSFDSDFTVELWVRQASSPIETFPILIERGSGTEVAGSWGILIDNSGANKRCSFFYGGPRTYVNVGFLQFDTWHHVAISRSGSTLRTFLDGVQATTATVTDNLTVTANLRVGSAGTTSNYFKGNIDDLRITKGVARYTSDFTPSTLTAPGASSDYNRITGLVGDGSTKYLDSNRSNNADPQNNQHVAVYQTALGTIVSGRLLSGRDPSTSTGSTQLSDGDGILANVEGYSRYNGTLLSITRANAPKFFGLSRSSSSSYTVRQASINTIRNDSSAAPNSTSITIFSNPAPNLHTNARVAFYSIGESLDLALLDSRVTTLMSDIATAISESYYANTTLVLNFDYSAGTGAAGIQDLSPYGPRSFSGTGTIVASPVKAGIGSLSNASIYTELGSESVTNNPGARTVEGWFYPTSFSTAPYLITYSSNTYKLELNTSGQALWKQGSTTYITHPTPLTLNAWNHVALTRQPGSSNEWRLHVNGVASSPSTVNLSIGSGRMYIYASATMHIDLVRDTVGVARYNSATFVPPSGPY